MHSHLWRFALLLCSTGLVNAISTLRVPTDLGLITGFTTTTTTNPSVAQFLGIPYAEPPLKSLRWAPAVPKKPVGTWDALAFSHSCSQAEPDSSGAFGYPAEFLIPPGSTSEDCLYLNVWAPYGKNESKREDGLLPVIVFIHGGGLSAGSGGIAYQIPDKWVQRSQEHIAVSINYRLGIFGFPNARGLPSSSQNLGLLDQRLALEWIRSNIVSFGGDPARITLWGQSAGAASIAYYHYAYPSDPIAAGMIQDSGTAYLPMGVDDVSHSNFTALARAFGCGGNASVEVECLREAGFREIQDYVSSNRNLTFNVVVDNKTKFADEEYPRRTLARRLALVPTIIGTNRDESGGNGSSTGDGSNVGADSVFGCPAHFESALRTEAGLTTYRYLYSGNFTNIGPSGNGAFHSAELPLITGAHNITRGASTAFEWEVSHAMQDHWLAFVKDPVGGLEKAGWTKTPAGDFNSTQRGIDIGYSGTVVRPFAWNSSYAAACSGVFSV